MIFDLFGMAFITRNLNNAFSQSFKYLLLCSTGHFSDFNYIQRQFIFLSQRSLFRVVGTFLVNSFLN